MEREAAIFSIDDTLELPCIQIDPQSNSIAYHHVDPIEYPYLYPFKVDYRLNQKVVLGKISYQQTYCLNGRIFEPRVELVCDKPLPENIRYVTLPIFNEQLDLETMNDVDFATLRAYMTNPKLPLNLFDHSATLALLNISDPERVQSALSVYIDELADVYGVNGMIKLLEFNHMEYSIVKPTRVNYMRLLQGYPNRKIPDSLFVVLAIDLVDHPEIPIIEDGHCHVSAIEYASYLKYQCLRASMTAVTRFYISKVHSSVDPRMLIFERLTEMANVTQKRVREAHTARRMKRIGITDIEDIAELDAQMPPCMQNMIKQESHRIFPSHLVRFRLVTMWRTAGITLDTIRRKLEYLYQLDNDGRHSSLKARFDYESVYMGEGCVPPKCATMDEYCPYACDKDRCHQEFESKFPDKVMPNDAQYLQPYKWYEWANRDSKRYRRRMTVEIDN